MKTKRFLSLSSAMLLSAVLLGSCGSKSQPFVMAENIPDNVRTLTLTVNEKGEEVPVSVVDDDGNIYNAATGEVTGHVDALARKDDAENVEPTPEPEETPVATEPPEQAPEEDDHTLDLTVSDTATNLQDNFYSALRTSGFYLMDVSDLNRERYPTSTVISGDVTLKTDENGARELTATATCIAGNRDEADGIWYDIYGSRAEGDNELLSLDFDPANMDAKKSMKMMYNGNFTRADVIGNTFIIIYANDPGLETYIDNLFDAIENGTPNPLAAQIS